MGEIKYEKENESLIKRSQEEKNESVKRLKRWIILTILVLLIIPTILCIILFFKINTMQKQINLLMKNSGILLEEKKTSSSISNKASITNKADYGLLELFKFINISTDIIPIKVKEQKPFENINIEPKIQKNKKDKSNDNNSQSDKKDESTELRDNSKINNKLNTKDINNDLTIKNNKTVYLTFDDGPSEYSNDILDLLEKYKVKATFFVIGKTDNKSKEVYKRIVEDGHSLGMHSYSHKYSTIYDSLATFKNDFKQIRTLLYEATGQKINIYRFPGGSGNQVSNVDISLLIHYLNECGVTYFDWNVVSGDATGEILTPQQMCDNVLSGINLNDNSIVLMHDTDSKKDTITTLKLILENLSQQGVDILPLNEEVPAIQQIKVGSIINK